MRDFNNLCLIQKIENNPHEYIIQRKVDLLDSFLLGYKEILLIIKDIDILRNKYKNVPSMQEYAMKEYNVKNIGSRNFKSLIKYNCENELEYYNNYLCFIKKYEVKYLLNDNVEYVIDRNPRKNLKDVLSSIKKRFPMYFGNYDLENLRAYIDGYIKCKGDYDIKFTDFEQKIILFLTGISCEIIEMEGKNITWDRKYRYNKYWDSWGQIIENQSKEIIDNFFEDLGNGIGEKI